MTLDICTASAVLRPEERKMKLKRTEDVFDVTEFLRLTKDGAGINVQIGLNGLHAYVEENLASFVAALQQFQKTGTFVKPKRWKIKLSCSTPGAYLLRDRGFSIAGADGQFLRLPKGKAQRIADILNEGEE